MKAFFAGIEGLSFLDIFLFATPLIKLMFIMLIIGLLSISVLAMTRLFGRNKRLPMLEWMGLGGLVTGVLGATYVGINTYRASQMSGVTEIMILAPSIFEIILLLWMGIAALMIALMGNFGTKRPV